MNKKFLAAIVITGIAALALSACGGNTKPAPASSGAEEASVIDVYNTTSNPWVINEDETTGWATEEARTAFNKATEGLTGAGYEIVAQLGQQVVAGTNYIFLCKETLVTAEPVTKLSFVTVYADLQGNAEIKHIEELDLEMFCGGENPASPEEFKQLLGGWSLPSGFQAVNLPAEVAAVYDKVLGDEAGFYPMAYLAHQDAEKANYALLCFDEVAPCLVYLHEPASGEPELISIYRINVAEFVGQ